MLTVLGSKVRNCGGDRRQFIKFGGLGLLAATIFTSLGIDPEMRVADAQGRPVPLVDEARPLVELFG